MAPVDTQGGPGRKTGAESSGNRGVALIPGGSHLRHARFVTTDPFPRSLLLALLLLPLLLGAAALLSSRIEEIRRIPLVNYVDDDAPLVRPYHRTIRPLR